MQLKIVALTNNYYVSTLAWSVTQKVLTALFGFISTPLLLGIYGKADYGLISIATACNGYMHLLDLGMNTGAVRYYSIWKSEGNMEKGFRVARTNLTFYGLIATLNILLLLLLAWFGEPVFSISHEQFLTLRICLYILAIFCLFNWLTTVYNQLLIADKQMTFTMQMGCISLIARGILLAAVFFLRLSLTTYFFFLTACVALLIIPYAWKCFHDKLIDSFKFAIYWEDFKPVLVFSLSIFALSLFQMTATHTRPIILSMLAEDGASCVTEFSIISVFPSLIITIGGTFSGIFLPKTSEMVARGSLIEMRDFAYSWTTRTSIIVNILTIPFVLCSKELLCAYVGDDYSDLAIWLVIWCFTVLIQMHTTPANALVLAYGKTKMLVVATAIFCILSVFLNICLCKYLQVGSAIVAYAGYVIMIIGLYYIHFYKSILKLSRIKMAFCFIKPTVLAIVIMEIVRCIPLDVNMFGDVNIRLAYLIMCIVKSIVWLIPFALCIQLFKIENIKEIIKR